MTTKDEKQNLGRQPLYRSSISSGEPPSLLHWLDRHADSAPEHVYIRAVDEQGKCEEVLAYGVLRDKSVNLAARLREDYGLGRGQTVAFAPVNRIGSVIAIFALMRLGVTMMILSPSDPQHRRIELCQSAGVSVRFHDPSLTTQAFALSIAMPAAANKADPQPEDLPPTPWSDLFLIGTSGSTASSKIVRQTHFNAAANAQDTVRHHKLTAEDRLLGCLPINHVNGLHFTLFATLAAGAEAILVSGFHPLSYAGLLKRYRPRIASVAPSLLEALASLWRSKPSVDGLDYFVSAAAPLSPLTARKVYEKMGARIVQSYGLTETTNFSCAMPTDLSDEEYRRLMLERDIPPVGGPVSNEIAILDLDGRMCSLGEIGEVCMRGPNVMKGYLGNLVETEAAFAGEWFHSGDLGYQIETTSHGYLTVLTGRIKNIAKVRGETVSLEEVDRALALVPGVSDAATVALPSEMDGEQVCAFVAGDVSDVDLLETLRAHLPLSAVPASFVRVNAIPRTLTGKVIRKQLADLHAGNGRDGLHP